MYRDPRAEALARLDAARDARARAWGEVTSLLEAIEVLRGQLLAKAIDPPPMPKVEAPDDGKVDVTAISLADALRAADAIECDEARLRTTVRDLTTFVTVLGDRLAGRRSEVPLRAPPRSVPWVYALAEMLPAWLIYVLPAAAVVGAVVAEAMEKARGAHLVPLPFLLLPLVVTALRARARVLFLRRCRVVASVTLESCEDTSTKNTNVPMRSASGWKVTRSSYTGYTVRNHLRWMGEDGTGGVLIVRGTPYDDGVVLHDGPKAICVVDLHCAPRPDARGEWEPTLAPMVWVRIVFVSGLFAALVYGYATLR
jgi:hypothetical protein